ncbi:MAG: oxidoreductase [Myxococcota bacterium]
MSRWTADDIPDQQGRVAVITGANSGIGLDAARMLAKAGATVVLACRNLEKAAAARGVLLEAVPNATLEVRQLDLADLSNIRAFADGFLDAYDRLDLLINNAGIMAIPRRETADGFEMQLGTNHLGHFALTGRLLSRLTSTADSRIVNVASEAHRIGRMDFSDLQGQEGYAPWPAYGQSKLANLLFTAELDRRLASLAPIAVSCHPGYAATNLQHVGPQMTGSFLGGMFMTMGNALFAQSSEMGALPTVYAATAREVEGNDYIGPNGPFGLWGYPTKAKPARAALSKTDAAELWRRSVALTGVDYAVLEPASA